MKKHIKRFLFPNSHILTVFSLLLFFVMVIGAYCWYQSRAIPEIGEEQQVTMLPPDVSNVLGANTNDLVYTSIRVPIFLYHYVEPPSANDPGRQKLNIPPSVLTSQIETLKAAGYTFITPDDLTSALLNKKTLPNLVIILSFDDGYSDFYDYVFPILKKEQVKAIFYIVPNFLNRPNYMFTYQLQEVAKSPFVEIGAHTMDHVWLAGKDKNTVTYQVSQSRKYLQNLLHVPVNSFAYPYGALDRQAINEVIAAGFTNAVSTIPDIKQNIESRYFLFRLRPGYRSGTTLLNYLKQDTFQAW